MLLAPDAHNQSLCPIWDGVNLGDIPTIPPEVISPAGNRYYSSRAGGPFRLMQSGAELLALDAQLVQSGEALLPAGQQANLSYWIYQHNLKHHLLDELTDYDCLDTGPFQNWMDDRRDRVLELDETWVVDHRDRKPSFLDRELTYLRELIRSNDADEQPNEDLLQAAGGCRNARDLAELRRHTVDKGWTGSNKPGSEGTSPYQINASARIHVEEQLREADQPLRKQVFAVDKPDESVFDVFICHTTEDKDDVARPLATALNDAGLRVWYDEFELKIGDSLRRKINKGLATSRFGVVVLSPAFFGRGWPEYELDGLTTQMVSRERVLLPVWHNVTEHDVMEYSPSLVDRVARSTETHTVEEIAAEIVDVIRNTPESVDAVQRQGHNIQALRNHDIANSHDSNLLCSSEEKALLLVMHETGSVPLKDLMGPVADGLEHLGLIKRHYGADGGIYGTITGKGRAYIRVWEEEDSNGAEPPH